MIFYIEGIAKSCVMKRKICFIVSSPNTAIAFFKDHIERLSAVFDVYLVANISSADDLSSLKLAGFKSIQIERRPSLLADIKSLFQLYRYFKSESFFCVHSMSSKPSLLTSIAGYMARIPHRIRIFTGQLWCNMTGCKRRFFKGIDKLTVALNTEVMVDGISQMEYLEENGVIRKGQARVMANGSICGVDTERFLYSDVIRGEEREKLRLTNEVVYMFLGRLKTEKGINELLSSMNRLVVSCQNSILILVGADEESCRDRLSLFPNLQDGKNVIFYGYTKTPNHLLQAADVFVMPSYREGFGVSVLEASCVRLPVICSDAYGMRDSMIDGVTGIRCKVKDVDSLYNAMYLLYHNPKLREKMGMAGYDYVKKAFTKQQVTDAWFEYYMNLK